MPCCKTTRDRRDLRRGIAGTGKLLAKCFPRVGYIEASENINRRYMPEVGR